MQYLIATTSEVVHLIALRAVHSIPLQEVHLSRYWHGKKENYDENIIYDYIGYLAGMHLFASGTDYIDVNYDCGISIWMDKKGNPHTVNSKWMKKMADKCRNILGLTYEVIRMDVDEQTYDECVNSDYFITDEKFFDRLAEQGDDLPF